ncbi:MAG: hypothetical protein ACPGVC_04820 [Salibacteraceae bacterium]
MKTFYTVLLSLFVSINAFSQDEQQVYDDTISVTEWLKRSANYDNYYAIFRNTVIELDLKGEDSNLVEVYFEIITMGSRSSTVENVRFHFERLDLPKALSAYMVNCKLNISYPITGLNISNLEFIKCDLGSLKFEKCPNLDITIINSKWKYISIKDCEINQGLNVWDSEGFGLFLNDLKFNGYYFQGFRSCISMSYSEIDQLELNNLEFNNSDSIIHDSIEDYIGVDLSHLKAKGVKITNTEVSKLSMKGATIAKSLLVDGLIVSENIDLQSVDLPLGNSNLNWNFISGNKICFKQKDSIYFCGVDSSQLSNTVNFNELLSIYQKMLNLYKERGDRLSFNACYVEMRELQTRKIKFEYEQQPKLSGLFNWRMNQFLKTFCDYGTDPVKPLIISMYVILAFGVMYFFFYNEWDKVNRQFLIKQHRKMLQYFSSEQKLEDFYTDEYKDDFKSYEAYKKEIEDSQLKVPFFIRVLGKPLYKLSLMRFGILAWLYRSTEVLQGKWSDLTASRKTFVGITVGSGIAVYLILLVFIRLLNSTMLSINTFSTLGFGDIPVKGVMKYMAILEGFLGWFLLSIFSVSLISQILPA